VDSELTSAAGEPGHEIVDVARRVPAKTIVLGEHHHGFLAKLFGGDVAAGVQRLRLKLLFSTTRPSYGGRSPVASARSPVGTRSRPGTAARAGTPQLQRD
jgi:hypothetical protein